MSGDDRNLTWHAGQVSAEERARVLGHRAATLWLTGLSGSGKSTIARLAEKALIERGALAYVLDGDNVRMGLNRDLGFGERDREENIRRIGEVSRLMVDAGLIVVTAFISPFRVDRERVRALLPEGAFLEVHVATSIEECERRDPKGLYARARRGEIRDFTGIDSPYEPPDAPELVVGRDGGDAGASAAQIVSMLEARGLLSPRG
ncbi:MAG: adenylyl-sulfate kinase [Myxococcota bacterium]|nr:adenylyl-sulfate kinase [Myxococcota bacterium]